ncbi:MAG TPA: hypothetical protein VN278_02995 [Methanosarcina sp.]|nr:hypothetical protein [Methanosarcina sp.]
MQDLYCGQMRALSAVAFFDRRSFSGVGSEGWCPGPRFSSIYLRSRIMQKP